MRRQRIRRRLLSGRRMCAHTPPPCTSTYIRPTGRRHATTKEASPASTGPLYEYSDPGVMQRLTLQCPAGAGPGTTVSAMAPDGTQLNVQVPAGVLPGMQFQVLVRAGCSSEYRKRPHLAGVQSGGERVQHAIWGRNDASWSATDSLLLAGSLVLHDILTFSSLPLARSNIRRPPDNRHCSRTRCRRNNSSGHSRRPSSARR